MAIDKKAIKIPTGTNLWNSFFKENFPSSLVTINAKTSWIIIATTPNSKIYIRNRVN